MSIAGLAIAALAYLARSLTQHLLDRDLKAYETSLRAQADRQLEAFKADLTLAAHEREIVLTALQERRVSVVAEFYKHVDAAYRGLDNVASPYLRGDPVPEEQASAYADSVTALGEFHGQNAIWLDPGTEESVFDFYVRAMIPGLVLARGAIPDSVGGPFKEGEWTEERVIENIRRAQEEAIELRSRLEADFRALLGVVVEGRGPDT